MLPKDNKYEALEERVKKVFEKRGYKNIKINMENGSKEGDGYIGVILKTDISAEKSGTEHNFDVMVKCTPAKLEVRKDIPVTGFFNKEIYFFNEIAPMYAKIQEKLGISEDDKFIIPKCMGTNGEYGNEFIILENLKVKGFSMKVNDVLDYKHATLAVKCLAKLHALSFAFQEYYPNEFSVTTSHLTDSILTKTDEYDCKEIVNYGEKALTKYLSALDTDELKKKLINIVDGKLSIKLGQLWGSGNIRVITHGDFWANNILFKYEDDEPVAALPLDYQVMRYASLTNDLHYIIGMSSEAELRRKHYWQLMDDYYFALRQFSDKLGININKYCTYDQFKEELKNQIYFSVLTSVYMIPFFTVDYSINLHQLFNGEYPELFLCNNERYVKRVNDMITDFVDFKLI